MSQKLYDEANIQDIADAIREKLGVQTQYLTSEMAAAIESIETSEEIPSANGEEF